MQVLSLVSRQHSKSQVLPIIYLCILNVYHGLSAHATHHGAIVAKPLMYRHMATSYNRPESATAVLDLLYLGPYASLVINTPHFLTASSSEISHTYNVNKDTNTTGSFVIAVIISNFHSEMLLN